MKRRTFLGAVLGAAAGAALVPYDQLFAQAPKLADVMQFGQFYQFVPEVLNAMKTNDTFFRLMVEQLSWGITRATDKAGFQILFEPARYAPRLLIKTPGSSGTVDPVNHYGTCGLKVCAYRTVFPKNDKNALYDVAMKDLYVNLLLHRNESEHARTRTLTQRDNHTS